jgi:pantoate--beta-alanine ligase
MIGNTLLETASSLSQLRATLDAARAQRRSIGLVPTMGALHEGHLSLVRAAKAECDVAVVSIYVNPTQFGPQEDLARYPRTLPADLELLASCAADVAFVPGNEEMYRPGYDTWVEPGAVAQPLEGQRRPGHFRGVATVVLKLLNMVRPDVAYFGQKDYQQVQVIRQMVDDLNVPVKLRMCPTLREPDGLALSSRNRYLTPAQRQQALVLWQSLRLAGQLVRQGQRDGGEIIKQMQAEIARAAEASIDYVALVDPQTLGPVREIQGRTLAVLAVRIGATRLIDNEILEPS